MGGRSAGNTSIVARVDRDRTREGSFIAPLLALTSNFHCFDLRATTSIVCFDKSRLYQTLWDTMERYFGLEITKPLLLELNNSARYWVTLAYFVTWFIQYRYPLVCHTISSTSVILSFWRDLFGHPADKPVTILESVYWSRCTPWYYGVVTGSSSLRKHSLYWIDKWLPELSIWVTDYVTLLATQSTQ